jgi:hypothetical protein
MVRSALIAAPDFPATSSDPLTTSPELRIQLPGSTGRKASLRRQKRWSLSERPSSARLRNSFAYQSGVRSELRAVSYLFALSFVDATPVTIA